MINAKRLDKYIHNKEWQKDRQSLVEIYDNMTKEQRLKIKEILTKNKNHE